MQLGMTKISKHKIIAISGLKNTGKDTTASMLVFCKNNPKFLHYYWIYKLFPHLCIKRNWEKVSFAHSLKGMLAVLLKIHPEAFEDRIFKENYCVDFSTLKILKKEHCDRTFTDSRFSKFIKDESISLTRDCLTIRQLMQYFGTEIMRDFFGDKIWCLSTLQASELNNIVISDLRFKTEANEVKKRRGLLICINRPGTIPGNHISEREVIELQNNGQFDFTIENNGTLKDLFNKVKELNKHVG